MILQALATAVLVVSPDGPIRTLGEAVRQASPGDTIVVRAGSYREPTVIVDRRVVILGEGRPVFDGQGTHEVILVTADSVELRGLVVRNTGSAGTEDRAGIRLSGVRGCVVEDNQVLDTYFGIYGERMNGSRIANNRVEGPDAAYSLSGNAIHCWMCRELVIEGNLTAGHRDGVYLEYVRQGTITGNRIERNLRYALHFMRSDSTLYQGNTITGNGAGVAVMYSRGVTMIDNEFSLHRGGSAYGLLLKEISDSRITGNRFLSNTVAMFLENSNRNRIDGNLFRDNGRAVRVLANAVGNEFLGNVFRGNSFDVTTNSRSATSRFEGNYWDQYKGWDLDRDGTGDVPHRPVRLFALLVEQNDPALILLRSAFVDLLDVAERVFPVLTPAALADASPLMRAPERP